MRLDFPRACMVAVVLVCLAQMHGGAQQPAGGGKVQAAAAFEVASMRLVPPGKQGMTSISPSGAAMFDAKNASAKLLLGFAFEIEGYQFAGVPGWADSAFYDVSAKPEGEKGLTYEQLRPMLQNLLRERLRLATHWSSAERSGYGLELRKGETGKRIQAGTGGAAGNIYILQDGVQGNNIPMKTLAALLSSVMGTPIEDETGLQGTYNVRLKFAPLAAADSPLPSLPSALEEMGLSLKRRKIAVRMLTVDHMERVPVAN